MKKKMIKNGIASLSLLALSMGVAHAHHGVNGQFDTSKSIEVRGVVTKVKFVNPHSYVYFDVTGADGKAEEWRCELSSGSVLKRKGWSVDMFATGTQIAIVGSPAREEANACYTSTITFADGNTIARMDELDANGKVIKKAERASEEATEETAVEAAALDPDVPNLNGHWVAERPERPGPPPGEKGAPPPQDGKDAPPPPPQDGKGAHPPDDKRGGPPKVERTEAGNAAVEGFVREDNPRFHCKATNILLDWWFDQLVNNIEQTKDDITLTYGFMDIVRTIHLDLDKHPENIEPSLAGHSIGQWEDGVLVVDTVGFAEGYLDVPPNADGVVRNSTQLHIVERFTLSEDGKTLTREYVADDALNIVGTYSGKDVVMRTDAATEPYACEDLTGKTY